MLELIRLVRRYGRRIGWVIWTTRSERRLAARAPTFRTVHGGSPTLPDYRRQDTPPANHPTQTRRR